MPSKAKLPDKFYDDVLIAKIADKLGIKSPVIKKELCELLEQSAREFFLQKDFQKKFTQKQTKVKFKRLATYMEKTQKLYNEATQQSLSGMGDFEVGLLRTPKDQPYRELIYDLYRSNEYFITAENVSKVFRCLELAFENAAVADSTLCFDKWDKTEVVLSWLWQFDDFWEKHSDIPITEGKHTELEAASEDEVVPRSGHDSPAIKVLTLMAQPINCHLEEKEHITNSMLTQAIRKRRNPGDKAKALDFSDEVIQ